MRGLRHAAGMSLVEATIILLVLMLLTAVLAPSIFDYYHDAQTVKVKEDCEAIGVSVARMVRDVGPCIRVNGLAPCTVQNRVEILFSDGPQPTPADVLSVAYASVDGVGTINWDAPQGFAGWSPFSLTDGLAWQMTENTPLYPVPAPDAFLMSGPAFGLGWRGAYLSSPIGPDPWGKQYLVNTMFLSVGSNSAAPAGTEGAANGGWNRDVFCVSPGFNRIYETPFGGNAAFGTQRGGDDFIYVISGSTR